jgi:hypothetical protein
MARRGVIGCVLALLLMPAALTWGQTVYRLKGSARAGRTPVVASVAAEALAGFRGEQFTGQKSFTIQANDKGEWNLLGLTAGVWLVVASAPDMLPAAVVLPIKFAQRQMQSAQGGQLNWPWAFEMAPGSAHPTLHKATPLVVEGRALEAVQILATALLPDASLEERCVAGEMALAVKQTGLAQQLFAAVQKADPKHPCGPMGLASAALMMSDWNAASKMLWIARDLAPREQRPALAAAINELQQVARVQ